MHQPRIAGIALPLARMPGQLLRIRHGALKVDADAVDLVVHFLADLPRGLLRGATHALGLGVAERSQPAVLKRGERRERADHDRHERNEGDGGAPHVCGESSIRNSRKPTQGLRFYVPYKPLATL